MKTLNITEFEKHRDTIATAVFDATTGNGRDLPKDDWDMHMENCRDAAHNEWHENITVPDWREATLIRVGVARSDA